MRTRQQLLHDVRVINLSASAKAVFFTLELLVFFYLDFSKLAMVRYVFPENPLYEKRLLAGAKKTTSTGD